VWQFVVILIDPALGMWQLVRQKLPGRQRSDCSSDTKTLPGYSKTSSGMKTSVQLACEKPYWEAQQRTGYPERVSPHLNPEVCARNRVPSVRDRPTSTKHQHASSNAIQVRDVISTSSFCTLSANLTGATDSVYLKRSSVGNISVNRALSSSIEQAEWLLFVSILGILHQAVAGPYSEYILTPASRTLLLATVYRVVVESSRIEQGTLMVVVVDWTMPD